MNLGKFQINIINDGLFRLDGGAMYGVVPKNLWSKVEEVDDQNRILMACNPLLIRTGKEIVLVDTGTGEKFPDKFNEVYAIDMPRGLLPGLRKLGVEPEDVTQVINTHLHFDHCGGNTRFNQDGEAVPTFPNAEYVINELEWEDAMNPNPRSEASYLPENLLPLKDAGQVRLTEGDAEIIPGIGVRVTGGHTRGHQIVVISSEGRTAVYLADLIPLTAQIRPNWVMSYDLYPVDTVDYKQRFVEEALANQYLLIFEHSPQIKAGYLYKDENGKLKIRKIDI
ncbi:MAG: MBL fold metallo-hydrolase [candidate division Zixibacteria bacterium]|nr:MBL fold metallo-hydrolase [Candidatus Tariuqbacter arcticus]